ncbi:transcriptional repressor LexA [Castellaniella sp.]|uniref:transcriptional repressor LexA n=1 Tax=Castellaniella sp. TaxID=1955812 RepID=UPI0035606189
MARKLTDRQHQILELIRQAILQSGRPPTRAEIAQELGFRSANAAEDHLRALERKGYIQLSANTSRGIRLTPLALPDQADHAEAGHAEAFRAPRPQYEFSATGQVSTAMPAIMQLPLVGRVAAGAPILATEHIETEVAVAPHLFARRPDYLLRVRGSSMRDAGILDGDLLAVQRTPEARHGQIVVARLANEVTVKRLSHQGRHISLLPENPDFSPIQIGPGDDFSIEGIAVGLIRTAALA